MIRRPPRSTRTDTLSLHDALPISSSGAMAPNTGRSDGRSLNNSREGRNMLLTTLKHATKHAALGVGLALAISGAAQAEKVLRVGNDGEPQSMDPPYLSR